MSMPNPPNPTTPDPFDPERLRLSQDFAAGVGVKKLLTTVPVRKPANEWFVQCHPDDSYRIVTMLLLMKEDRETYLVDRSLWDSLATEPTVSPRLLITTITSHGILLLWPIRLPGADGRIDAWNRSAMEAATLACGKWIRVAANTKVGANDIIVAANQMPAPEWPATPFNELLRIAFKDMYIDSINHPVLKKLRGEM